MKKTNTREAIEVYNAINEML